MKLQEALTRMEYLGKKHFNEYTIQINKYSDGDYRIEVCHVPYNEHVHKFTYRQMQSESHLHKKIDANETEVLELMVHPSSTGGLGITESEPGHAYIESIGNIKKVTELKN